MSYKGYLSFPLVLLISFVGTLTADQTLFYVGRHYGPGLLKRKPQWQERVDKIFTLLHRHNFMFILTFRFIYGIRTLSPLVIGASGVSVKRFTVLNLIAAVLWTLISCTGGYALGYFFGDAIEDLIDKVIGYQKILIISVIIIVILAILIRRQKFDYTKIKALFKKNTTNSDDNG